MEKVSLEQLVKITEGRLIQKGKTDWVTGAAIDSRKIEKNDLFIPIKGEKVDGHRFIETAAEKGCSTSFTETEVLDFPEGINIVLVESCLEAMKALAKYNRERYDIPVIAVTGSSGKTTTKDLIASVLSRKYNTLKTQGNFNNEYGIPQTLFNLQPEHEIAVIEMGMDHLNDIRKSIGEVRPHIGVITNIGTAHIEILKTQDNILAAKKEIFETMGAGDIALLNGDDVYLNKIREDEEPFSVARVGIRGAGLSLKAEQVESSAQGIRFEADGEHYHFAYPGIHNVYNCLTAIWLGRYYQMTRDEIQRGLDAFKPSGNRMDIVKVKAATVINDSYNANPDAMKAALDMLWDMGKGSRRLAVLGDMLEMGEMSETGHLEIGAYAAEKADVLIAVGPESKAYIKGAGASLADERCFWSADAESAGRLLRKLMAPGDVILIKASRGVHLEKTLEMIQE
ncbi:MAG: UDP-N-acetylmuramoyl-tripeptide--D-alanyl-D-alanine ligase [Eubacterium sp.]|uniref:UDP-N-acetylmuramoyl-tripeptide--D-alanyl-D- alanine ligase n=1 Tax=Eubacterium sp. TaxID=142586 RepID=UPI003048BA0F